MSQVSMTQVGDGSSPTPHCPMGSQMNRAPSTRDPRTTAIPPPSLSPLTTTSLFVGTSYSPDVLSSDGLLRAMRSAVDLRRAVAQIEVCPTTGRRHVQMAVQLTRNVDLGEALRLLAPLLGRVMTPDGERCGGRLTTREVGGATRSWLRMAAYATKAESRAGDGFQLRWWGVSAEEARPLDHCLVRGADQFEGWIRDSGSTRGRDGGTGTGGAPRAGRAAGGGGGGSRMEETLEEALVMLRAGVEPLEVCERLHILRELTRVEKMAAHLAKRQRTEGRDVQTEYHYGVSGGGKSTAVRLANPGAYWKVADSSVWWDGYSGQDVIIIDDIRARDFPATMLLRILDGNPLSLQVKGGYVQANWTRVIITSNVAAADLSMQFHPDVQEPLRRRLFSDKTKLKYYAERWAPPGPGPAQEAVAVESSDGEGEGITLWDTRAAAAAFATHFSP